MIGTPHILVGDQMEEDEMGRVCGTCEGQWEGIQSFS
jgi:hypothetical protein